MSLTVSAISSPSPLTALSRPPRQRRQSPPYLASGSRRGSPIPLSTTETPAQSSINAVDNLDDSDDEGAKAPQLSALARMLLDDFPEADNVQAEELPAIKAETNPAKRLSWSQSPTDQEYPTVRSGSSTGLRGTSREGSPEYSIGHELVTPAPGKRSRRLFTGTYANLGSSGSSSNSVEANRETENRYIGTNYGSVIRQPPGSSIMGGTQASSTASAIRWKRAGRGLFGGLTGPPRRGPRRDSDQREEDQGEHDGYGGDSEEPKDSPTDVKSPDDIGSVSAISREEVIEQPMSTISRRSRRESPESFAAQQQARLGVYGNTEYPDDIGSSGRSSSPPSSESHKSAVSSSSMSRAAAVTAAAVTAASASTSTNSDKENMPPPTFRRPTAITSSHKRLTQPEEKDNSPSKNNKPLVASPERKNALSSKSSNTPLRPAPPPPKMSMLEAVTASAGASVTATSQSSRKQRSTVHVNGRPYRRLDAIGKGGSSKVYKVMAENFKILAMKKVTFSAHDGEAAIRGYKGEIELLNKLSGVERVIRLYDWEINDEKQTLTMLMECGETDLAKVLTLRHGAEDSQMDISFIRYYWREMLLCVEAVHALNIIHSDLKPANFLLVQGRLKLIDFGIANAIQDDTVHVHRESQVGTLNYMSPEAIVDINASSGKAMASVGAPRLMKLGAPSDVWSLGCILYQMTYGKTPFSHLTSMYQKINAIPDPNHPIDYPPTGIGGVPVPRSLINTIKGCLQRDKNERPTIGQLLSDDDPFLNPDRAREGVVDVSMDMLRLLLENTVDHVAEKGAPSREITAAWAKDVYSKLERRMWERGRGAQR